MARFRLMTHDRSAFFQGITPESKSVIVTTELLNARIFDDACVHDIDFIALLDRLDKGFVRVNTMVRLDREKTADDKEEASDESLIECLRCADADDKVYVVDNDGLYYMEWPKPYGPVFTKDPGLARKVSQRVFTELCAEIGAPLTKCPFPAYIAQTEQGCYFTGWDDGNNAPNISVRLSEAVVFVNTEACHALWQRLSKLRFKRKSLFLHTYIVEDERRGHMRTVQAISPYEAAITMDRTNNGYYVTHYSVYKSDEKGEAKGDPIRFEVSWSSDWSVARLLTEKCAAPPDQRIDTRELKSDKHKLQKLERFHKAYGGGTFGPDAMSEESAESGHVIFFKQNASYFKCWVQHGTEQRPAFTRDLQKAKRFPYPHLALPVRNQLEKMILTDQLVVHGIKAIAGTLLVIHTSNIWYSADGWFIANEAGEYLSAWPAQQFTASVTSALRITDTRVLDTTVQLLSCIGIVVRRTPGDAQHPYVKHDKYKVMIGNAYYLEAWKGDSDPILTSNRQKAISLGWDFAMSLVNKLKTCSINARILRDCNPTDNG